MTRLIKLSISSLAVLGLVLVVGYTALTVRYNVRQTAVAAPELSTTSLLAAVNTERAKAGVAPLRDDPLLDKSAQLKADEIASTGNYDHVDKYGKHGYQYIPEVGANCAHISENLAGAVSTQDAITRWLASKPHREAMLNPMYDATGFGISQGPGYKYLVEHFCDLP